MPTYLEVPFGAVEGIRSEIVEPLDSIHEGDSAVHLGFETYGIRACNVFPMLTKTVFIQKHNSETLDYMFFKVAVLKSGASPERC